MKRPTSIYIYKDYRYTVRVSVGILGGTIFKKNRRHDTFLGVVDAGLRIVVVHQIKTASASFCLILGHGTSSTGPVLEGGGKFGVGRTAHTQVFRSSRHEPPRPRARVTTTSRTGVVVVVAPLHSIVVDVVHGRIQRRRESDRCGHPGDEGRSGASLYGLYSAEDDDDGEDDDFGMVSSRTYGGVFVGVIVQDNLARPILCFFGRVPCAVLFATLVMTSGEVGRGTILLHPRCCFLTVGRCAASSSSLFLPFSHAGVCGICFVAWTRGCGTPPEYWVR